MKNVVLSLALACPVFAGELAVLQNGFRIRAERHETIGDTVRLFTSQGTVEVSASNIAGFEVEEYVAPPPASPVKMEAVVAPEQKAQPSAKELLEQAASVHGLRPEFVQSVAAAESGFRQTAVSPKGAVGLMQLMPETARELGANPHDAAENAEAGARYLKQLLLKYAHTSDPVRLALAAYNAGPGAVDKYGRIPPYRETQEYVERVLRRYLAELKANGSRT